MPASKKTPERIEAILQGLSRGTPLTVICRNIGCDDNTVRDWMKTDEELSSAIARARELGFDAIASEALDLIDAEPARVEGRIDPGHVQWKKAQVDTRLKLLAKWDPKRYGEKTQTELTGANGGPVRSEVTMASPQTMAELTQALLSAAKGGEK
jgi:transposase-like protein